MSKWEMVRLGDLATYINGYAFKPSDWGKEGLPIIRIQNLTGNAYETNYYNGIYDSKYEIDNGTVLISWSASLGIFLWQGEKALLNQHIFKVVFNKVTINKNYFIIALTKLLQDMSGQAHGSTMKHITKPRFDNTLCPLPPLDIQKKIADELDSITSLMEKRKTQLEKLDLLIKAKFVEMFGCVFSNQYKFVESTIGDSCNSVKDGPHVSPKYVDNGIPFISVRNIIGGKIDFSDAKYISRQDFLEYTKKGKPERGDLLYSKGGTTGIAKHIDIDDEFCNWVHLALLKFDASLINPIFFENMLNSDYCYLQSQNLTKGIANRDLVLSSMKKIRIFLPPLPLQNQFADYVQKVEKVKESMKAGLEKIELLYNSRMQEYFG